MNELEIRARELDMIAELLKERASSYRAQIVHAKVGADVLVRACVSEPNDRTFCEHCKQYVVPQGLNGLAPTKGNAIYCPKCRKYMGHNLNN